MDIEVRLTDFHTQKKKGFRHGGDMEKLYFLYIFLIFSCVWILNPQTTKNNEKLTLILHGKKALNLQFKLYSI